MILFLVFLEIAQQPGGAKNFSPKVYYLVACGVYAVTFAVCVYTFSSGIGKITSDGGVQTRVSWQKSFLTQTFTSMFWETKMLTFGRIWQIQMTWSVVPLALPYAATNTSNSTGNDGENFLQWAIIMGYIMEFLGATTSYIPTGKYWITESIVLNTSATVVIAIAACNIGEWSSWEMRISLIIAVCVNRFTFGWVMPLIPRELSRRYPDAKELTVRSNALWSLYANILVRLPLWYFSKDFPG